MRILAKMCFNIALTVFVKFVTWYLVSLNN